MPQYLAENVIPVVAYYYSNDPIALAEGLADASLSLGNLLKGTAWAKDYKTDWAFNVEVIWLAWELMLEWVNGFDASPETFLIPHQIDTTKGE